ncbi:MAG TPA: ribonuclease Z [Thermodesulfobacteriota bacterium]|nr:ribonuclease Z [Deltaproteobacteria bacterium]HNR11824.1 ribonuclease Z [Thermodesulfobacteriota bacterium]HNU70542.1 ribonuclease Z [Thermodesulfobacteriota bacterium]HOC38437.1 ribonuclease Z [Thermodesulfobacteriota bacterium]HQO78850.1 ribonuclease Z [Thermodesulfobacteriota bacterium]
MNVPCVNSKPPREGFSLTILGSGTGVPQDHRRAPGLVIQAGSIPLLFDSGSGAAYQLPAAGFCYSDFDHLFFTHYDHPDHVNDLAELLFANKYFDPRRTRKLSIYGPPGIKKYVARLAELYSSLEDLHYPLDIREIEENEFTIDEVKIFSRPLDHQGKPCVGYRIDYRGKTVAYSGDTDYCDNLITLALKSDILVVECSFPNELKTKGHLTPRDIADVAVQARVSRVVLTHLYPPCDQVDIVAQVREGYDGIVVKAEDLMRIDLT